MKKTLVFILLFVVFCIAKTMAQYPYAVAVSLNGILLGKFKVTPDTRNAVPDTISADIAKSIFAINSFHIDKDGSPKRLTITEFQMTVKDGGEKNSLISKSEFLNGEQKNMLENMKSGSLLYFEGIRGQASDGSGFLCTLLEFYIE